ncbi:MAG: hypothetical protein K2P99_02475, partial [Burkholderiales bacterium]|nr:hypothetical protein [Burkholderiales bacterium]
ISNLNRDIETQYAEITAFINQKKDILQKYNINIDEIINVEINLKPLKDYITYNHDNIDRIMLNLTEDSDKTDYEDLNVKLKHKFCLEQITKIQGSFKGKQKEYQEYLENMSLWEQKNNEINGSILVPNSLQFLNLELAYVINDLEKDIGISRKTRLNISKQIFEKKEEIKLIYDKVKTEIDKQLSNSNVPGLKIVSSFEMANNFEQIILGYIHKNKSGSFCGTE